MTLSLLPQPLDLLRLMLNALGWIDIQERKHYVSDFIEYAFNTGLHRVTCEQICFRLV